MKKALAILLTLVMIVGVFAGCATNGSNDSSTPVDSSKVEESQSSESGAEETDEYFTYDGVSAPVVTGDEVITFKWLSQSDSDDNNTVVMQKVQEIWGEKVKIEWEIKSWSEYQESVSPRLAAGTSLPDICRLPGSNDDSGKYYKSGLFQDITDIYEKYGYNLKRVLTEEYPEVGERLLTSEGKRYYVPAICMSKDYGVVMMINGRWLEAVDMEAPTTTEELYDLLKAFKEKDPNGNGQADEVPFSFANGGQYSVSTLFGIDLSDGFTDISGEWEDVYTCSDYREYLRYMHKLYAEGLLDNGYANNDGDMVSNKAANDLIGLVSDWAYAASYVYSPCYDDYDGTTGIWHEMVPVKAPNGEQFYRGIDPLDSVYGITKVCEHPELAFAIMDYLFNEDMQNLCNLGIKGEDWKVNDDGSIWVSPESLENENLGTLPRNLPRIQSVITTDLAFPQWHIDENRIVREYVRLPLAWAPVTDEDNDIWEQYYTDLSKYQNECLDKFISGDMDVENDWDTYVAQCANMHQADLLQVFLNAQK